MKNVVKLAVLALLVGMFSGCDFILDPEAPTPTKAQMKDMWKVTAVYDNDAPKENIVESLQLGLGDVHVPFIFNMKDKNDFNTTAGPLFLYMVYGDSKWTQITGQIDQVFDYADKDAISSGTWALGDEVEETFMIEVKLQPPGFGSLVSVIERIFGASSFSQKMDQYALHMFKFVEVSFEGDKMIWKITESTETEYYTETFDEQQGKLVDIPFVIQGNKFSRCRIEFESFDATNYAGQTWFQNLTSF